METSWGAGDLGHFRLSRGRFFSVGVKGFLCHGIWDFPLINPCRRTKVQPTYKNVMENSEMHNMNTVQVNANKSEMI